jgi:hypothetical protein
MSIQAGGVRTQNPRQEAALSKPADADVDADRAGIAPAAPDTDQPGLDDEAMDTMDATANTTLEDNGSNGSPNGKHAPRKQRLGERLEAFVSKLSTRSNFWHRVCSMIWLPYAFASGIKMKQLNPDAFVAVLPFRRFNRNWYNAMAGAALLGNTEIAGGLYVFGVAGEKYTVVCKNLQYKFLRPCMGPAVYRVNPREDIHALLATGGEFNITLDMEISQQLRKPGQKDKRVGRAEVIFHVTPKVHHKEKRQRRKAVKTDE